MLPAPVLQPVGPADRMDVWVQPEKGAHWAHLSAHRWGKAAGLLQLVSLQEGGKRIKICKGGGDRSGYGQALRERVGRSW